MAIAKKQLGPDLAPLLAKSIIKVREQKAADRIWTDAQLEVVHRELDVELWRMAWRGIEC